MIKNYISLLFCVVALFVSCNKTNVERNTIDKDKGVRLIIKTSTPTEPETKLGYAEGESAMTFTWEDGIDGSKETFTVFQPYEDLLENTATATQQDEGGRSSGIFAASFSGMNVTTDNVYALYPESKKEVNNPNGFMLDLRTQNIITNTDQLKHNKSHYMRSRTILQNNQDTAMNFKFQHKVSILKAKITLPEGAGVIHTIKLMGTHAQVKYNIFDDTFDFSNINPDGIVLTSANGVAPIDNKMTVYIYIFPEDLRGENNLTLQAINADGKLYAVKFNGRNVEAGKIYDLDKSLQHDTSLSVGDYYMKDGTILPGGIYSLTNEQKANCAGVIYELNSNGTGGKVLCLEEGDKVWSTVVRDEDVYSKSDGAANTNQVLTSLVYKEAEYPVFAWCVSKNNDNTPGLKWYIPATSEVQNLYCHFIGIKPTTWITLLQDKPPVIGAVAKFNLQLSKAGGDIMKLDNHYTASTEVNGGKYIYWVNFVTTSTANEAKTKILKFRLISTFDKSIK